MYFRHTLIIFWMLIGWSHGQEADLRLTAEERKETLQKIQGLLADNYVFADTARKCIDYLRQQIEQGSYDAVTHPRAFVRRLNSELAGIHHDQHLRLSFVSPESRRFEEAQPDLALLTRSLDRQRDNYGIKEIKIYPDNIGYISMTSFEPLEMSRAQIIAALKLIENTAAVIFDLRQNEGGNLNTVQFICSFFLPAPKLLFSYYWRRGDYIEHYYILPKIPGSRRPEVPVFILIGKSTFSAAEEFAYSMQMQKRALIIGESSGGGANPGYAFEISPRFSIFIPTGRAINPVSNTNWEGKGVVPDVKATGTAAFTIALDRAGAAARSYQKAIDDQAAGELVVFSALLERLHTDSTQTNMHNLDSLLNRLAAQNLIDEWTINTLGYRYLNQNLHSVAIALFSYNTTHFPESVNAFDSLGEVYYRRGDHEAAKKYYLHSLSLDPNNQNAQHMLKQIEKGY